jgi:hypothetical protein
MMPREMVRKPLEQTMVLLWIIGVSHIFTRFVSYEFSYTWVISSLFASLLCGCFVIRYSIPKLVPLPVLLGLAAFLVLLKLFGVTASGLALASVIYALGLWRLIHYAKNPPIAAILAGLVSLREQDDNKWDIGQRANIIHGTLFVIVLAGGTLQFALSGLLIIGGIHSLIILLTMLLSALFFGISGHIYRQLAQSYLMLLFLVFAAMELVSLLLHPFSFQGIFHDRYAGLLFTMLGLMMWAVARYSESADAVLVRKPIEQNIVFLGLIGLSHIFTWFVSYEFSYTWVISSLFASFLCIYFVVRYQIPQLLPLPVLLGLAAFLVLLKLFGVSVSGLTLASVIYALGFWQLIHYAKNRPLPVKVGSIVSLCDQVDHEWDRGHKGDVIQGTSFVIVLASGTVQFAISGLLTIAGEHSLIILLTMLLTALFFLISGRVYCYAAQRYLVLLFSVFAAMELVSLFLHAFSFQGIFDDRVAGLLFAMLGLTMCAVAWYLKPADTIELETQDSTLYRKPLMLTAILMAVISVELQTLQVIKLDSMEIHSLPSLVMGLSAIGLLLANYRMKLPLFDLGAMLISILALLWLEFYFVHANQLFNLWPNSGYEDQWLILGLLSLASAFYAYYLQRKQTGLRGYYSSFMAVSAICYGWALLHAIVIFLENPFFDSPFLFWMCLIFIVGQFPILHKVPNADRIRGITIALFLLVALINLLATLGWLDQLRISLAVYAYLLLIVAAIILPSTNTRWPEWAIAQDYWPWIGLILIYASLLMGDPVWTQEWPWLVGAVFYQLFLRKIYLDLSAVLLLVLAALWAEAHWLHPGKSFSLLPGWLTYPDLWLTLSLAALTYSGLSQWLSRFPLWAARYSPLLQISAALSFSWSFLAAMVLFSVADNGNNILLPWIFLMLLLTLFPLLGSKALYIRIRGAGAAILFTLAVVSLLLNQPVLISMQTGIVLLGYSLWLIAGYVIPRFNKLWPDLALDPSFWPWVGAFLVAISCRYLQSPLSISLSAYLFALSGYSLLMLRYSSWAGFSWIAALAFAAVGFAYNGQRVIGNFQTNDSYEGFPFIFAFNTLLWGNLQLLLVRLVDSINSAPFERFRGQRRDLAGAFELGALIIITSWLMAYVYLFGKVSLYPAVTSWLMAYAYLLGKVSLYHPVVMSGKVFGLDALLLGVLLNLSLLHSLSLRFAVIYLHGFILTLFLIASSGYLAFIPALHSPLFLALWSFLPITTFYFSSRMRDDYQQTVSHVLDQWAGLSLVFATVVLAVNWPDELSELLLPLAIITVLTAFWGLWTLRSAWFALSCVEFFVFLHLWPFLWVSPHNILALLPWFAQQGSLLAWLFFGVVSRFSSPGNGSSDQSKRIAVCRMTLAYWPWLLSFSLGELIIHGLWVWRQLLTDQTIGWLFPGWDSVAAFVAGLIIIGFGFRHIRKSPNSNWVYANVMLVMGMGFYMRMIALGASLVGFWDTTLLIVLAYALFFLQRVFPSKPLLNLALFMPLLALLTVPFQLESPEASTTLMVTGFLYLMIRRYTQKQFPVYLALLAFNVGLYLWIPGIAKESQLIQVYVIPAALSVLILLQLHRHELKPSVLMSTRLAATSMVYASATLDVFLLPDMGIFILALLLSFVGILLGISLRIRAFLYAGVCFLLLNVVGQLIRFYPEQALGKAIILMTMGMAILCSMIWFNLKKAVILQHINVFRAELQGWE